MNLENNKVYNRNAETHKMRCKRKGTIYKFSLTMLTILSILTIFGTALIASSAQNSPPDGVSNLVSVSHTAYSITWTWTDPANSDLSHVNMYINGVFKIGILKGTQTYTATGLNPNTKYELSTRAVDTSSLVSNVEQTNTVTTDDGPPLPTVTPSMPTIPTIPQSGGTVIPVISTLPPSGGTTIPTIPVSPPSGDPTAPTTTIRFVTIGDTHITRSTSTDQYKRLTQAINYINNMTDVDFVVELGDIVDTTSDNNFVTAKSLISKLNKPYYVIIGNHDAGSNGAVFTKYFGPIEHMDYVNGYQLIFAGLKSSGSVTWSFNYNIADKSKPTVIFSHGPVQPDIGKATCQDSWGDSLHRYACSMITETNKFADLLGFYDGHVHVGTTQTIGNTLYVTQDNLGGRGAASDYIGYTVIQNGIVNYSLLNYT